MTDPIQISEVEAAVTRAVTHAYPDWMTVAEVAKYLKVSPHTIRKYVRKKRLAAYGQGRLFRVRRVDTDRFMTEQVR